MVTLGVFRATEASRGHFQASTTRRLSQQGNIKDIRFIHRATEMPCSEKTEMVQAGLATEATTVINDSPVSVHVSHASILER